MPSFARSLLLPYRADDMFALVDRVEDYALFLPWCEATAVKRFVDSNRVEATMTVRKGPLCKSFATNNIHDSANGIISMRLAQGMFSNLEGYWRFKRQDQACRISFTIDYAFPNLLASKIFGPLFAHAYGRILESFAVRAHELNVS